MEESGALKTLSSLFMMDGSLMFFSRLALSLGSRVTFDIICAKFILQKVIFCVSYPMNALLALLFFTLEFP
jgi:hypothetical protein